MKLMSRWGRFWCKFRGLMHCPHCRYIISPRIVKDWMFDPEEPPLFYHLECPRCYRKLSHVYESVILIKTARRHGYESFFDMWSRKICCSTTRSKEN